MNSPHKIRICGPWQRLVKSGEVDDTDSRTTVQMPASWAIDLGKDFQGQVQYKRFFNRPTSVDCATKILVVFERVVGHATIQLNGDVLGTLDWPKCSDSFEVTGRLANRNELVVEVTSLTRGEVEELRSAGSEVPAGGLVGEVRLEIG
jgi:hypothetical protein